MTAPVFLADPGSLDALDAGARYVLHGDEARHAGVVQRRRPGERVDVVDGAGVRLECVIAAVEPRRVDLDVVHTREEPASASRLVLVQALAKGDRDELAIEAATEVGVDEVVPWQAKRSVVVWRGDRAARSRARWIATVRTATKQARRAWVPVVAEAVTLDGLVRRVTEVVGAGGTALVLHEAATEPLVSIGFPTAQEIQVIVGPEGGITEDELVALVDAGARLARLGPHVLRTSTAGPVALGLVCARLGRWS